MPIMINTIINGVVLAIFGLIIGAVLQLLGLMEGGVSSDLLRNTREKRNSIGKIGWKGFIKESLKAAEEGRKLMQTMPRSRMILLIAFYGLIAVLILIVKYGPIEMNWWILIGSISTGFVVMDFIYYKAKKGKLRIEGHSIFDVLPNERRDN
jgi:hypothetical protein